MLFIVDEIRRVATETLLPYLTQNKEKVMNKLAHNFKKQSELKKVEDKQSDRQALILLEELEELEKDELEIFDDFLEMIVTFGYITMFGSSFSLSAPLSFVFILIEARSDMFKLERTLKRPLPGKTHHIGSWGYCLQLFCFLSVFSNIIVSCYASRQMDNLIPWLASYKDDSKTAVATVFALEHVLLLTVFSLKLFLDRDPEWINVFYARRAYRLER